MSALYRMAYNDHRKVEITANDLVVVSANPIPGNEKLVSIAEALVFGSELLSICRYLHIGGYLKGDFLLFERIKEDIKCFCERDPAATSAIEVMLLYPGFKAIRSHRKAHWFYNHNMFFIARMISQHCVRKTGIEIHPGAQIGRRFFIDHGTGTVIGETTVIGDDVTVYQGVTLGGTGKDIGKRHPTIGNNVLIGAGAKILGPVTVGDNTNIAAGAVVLDKIPKNSTAVGVPARVVRRNGERVQDLDQIHIPDPVSQELCRLQSEIEKLKKKLEDK